MEANQVTQQKLLELIEKRQSQYDQVLVSSVLVKYGDIWRSAITKFEAISTGTQIELIRNCDYNEIVAIKCFISIDELKEIVNQLFSGKVNIKGVPSFEFKGGYFLNSEQYYKSNEDYTNSEWPTNFYQLTSDDATRGPINRRNIVAIDAPFFPSGTDLLGYWTDLNVSRYGQFWNSILISLPNYQARIIDLTIEAKLLKIKVDVKGVEELDIIGKLFCSTENEYKVEDFFIKDHEGKVDLDEIPDILAVSLLSKKTGELLDYRTSFDPLGDSNIDIEPDASNIKMLINLGENEQVEYKESLNAQRGIIQSAVAFANTDGGVILVGVNDNGVIVGVDSHKPEETITNMIRNNTQPEVPTRIRTVTINGEQVVVVQVLAGEYTPYWHRDNGTFVRINSTNRHASPSEIKQLVDREQFKIGDSI